MTQSRLPRRALRAVVGAVFSAVALMLVASVSGPVRRDFSFIGIGVFLAGLTVDALVGERIRAGIGLHR